MSTGSNNSSLPFPEHRTSSDCYVDSEFRYTLFTVCYSIVVVLGSPLNLYAFYILVMLSTKMKLNEIKIFMLNLTIADLLFLATLPMWTIYYHQHGNWIIEPFFCNIAGYLYFVSKYCSVLFLGAITFNQFQAITRPISAIQVSTRKRAFIITLGVWTFILCPPLYYLFGDEPIQETVNNQIFLRCFERHNNESHITILLVIHVIICIGFFAVTFLVLACNFFIIQTLFSTSHVVNIASERLRVMRFVCTIVTVFMICLVPHHLIDIPWTMTYLNMPIKTSCQSRILLNDIHQVTLCFLAANCVVDPMIYCFLSTNFKKHFMEKMNSINDSFKCTEKLSKTSLEETVTQEVSVSASAAS